MDAYKHTPGPWFIIDDRGTLLIKGSTVDTVAKLYYPPNGSADANARLIAAAPELLKRLREACDLIAELSHFASNNGGMIDEEEFAEGRAAIAAATGEPT